MFLVDITNISHTYRVNELAFSITKVVNITNKTKKSGYEYFAATQQKFIGYYL